MSSCAPKAGSPMKRALAALLVLASPGCDETDSSPMPKPANLRQLSDNDIIGRFSGHSITIGDAQRIFETQTFLEDGTYVRQVNEPLISVVEGAYTVANNQICIFAPKARCYRVYLDDAHNTFMEMQWIRKFHRIQVVLRDIME